MVFPFDFHELRHIDYIKVKASSSSLVVRSTCACCNCNDKVNMIVFSWNRLEFSETCAILWMLTRPRYNGGQALFKWG